MVAGRKFWILIWYAMLVVGVLGLGASIYWARRTHWRNVDEFLRGIGTVLVSLGMLALLYGGNDVIGTALMIGAVGAFVSAFVIGRRVVPRDPEPGDHTRS